MDTRKKKSKIIPGFHGDLYLLQIVDFLLGKSDYFIETGSNVGITLNYVGYTYPKVVSLSCEPNRKAFLGARARVKDKDNVDVFNESSQNFLKRLYRRGDELFEKLVVFWLDAHGHGFKWPLREEVAFITKNFKNGFILIDDFRVPHNKNFKYNRYGKQHCSYEFIRNSIDSNFKFNLYYPDYTEKTSPFHPLVGWGLFQFGDLIRLDKGMISNILWASSK